MKTTRKGPYLLALTVVLVLIFSAFFFATPQKASSSSGTSITGYFWSDTIGWISMSGSGYGVSIDSSGNLSGDAWSDNIGWVQFGGLSSFPSGSGTTAGNAQIQSNGALTGWARACAGTAPGDCSSMTSRADGWDGWISLSGTGYGATLTSGVFSGYAWGDVNVGWVDTEYASTNYNKCTAGYTCSGQTIVYTGSSCNTSTTTTCVSPNYCSAGSSSCLVPPITVNPGGNLTVVPDVVQNNETATVSWNISNVQSCSVSGSNGDGTTGSTDPNSPGVWSVASGTEITSGITAQTIYTLSCNGDSDASPPTITQTVTVNIAPQFQEK